MVKNVEMFQIIGPVLGAKSTEFFHRGGYCYSEISIHVILGIMEFFFRIWGKFRG
jgi:hypothetical protein